MSKVRVSKISVKNILGIEELEFEPGCLTVIKGPNGKGKTSVLEAIRGVFQGGNDATLLRNGASEGEIVLLLDDGSEITKKVTATKSSVSVKHPNFGKSSRPQSVLDQLVNNLTLNPVEFLVAGAARQKEMLLKAIPMQVTKEQILDATGVEISTDYSPHALEVIAVIAKELYDRRTGLNRSLKDKNATAEQLQASLPDDPPNGDWLTRYNTIATLLDQHENDTEVQCRAIKDREQGELDSARESIADDIARLEQEAMREIDAIRAKLKEDIESSRMAYDTAREEISERARMGIQVITIERQPERDQLLTDKQHARTMSDMSVKAESAKELLRQMISDVGNLQSESRMLTHGLDGLKDLQGKLTSTLPIRGLQIKDGELYLDDIKFSRCNEARRVTVAIELAKLSAGNLGLVVVDGLERLDSETFSAFAEQLRSDESCQFVVTRVSDDAELNISTL